MKISDLKTLNLPIKVKLTDGFELEESFDVGTIIQINSFELDSNQVFGNDGRIFVVNACALPDDMEYNNSIASKNWFDDNGNPTVSYFEVNKPNNHGQYHEKLYVMENDDFCELMDEDTVNRYSINDIRTVLGNVLIGDNMKLVREEIILQLKNNH